MIFTESVQSLDIETLIEDLHTLLDIWEANHLHEGGSTILSKLKGKVPPWMRRTTKKSHEPEGEWPSKPAEMSKLELRTALGKAKAKDEPEEPVTAAEGTPKETLRALITSKANQLRDAIEAYKKMLKQVKANDWGETGAWVLAQTVKKRKRYQEELEALQKKMRDLEVHDAPEAAFVQALKSFKKNYPSGGQQTEAYELGHRFGTTQDQVDAFFHELVRRPTYGEGGRLL